MTGLVSHAASREGAVARSMVVCRDRTGNEFSTHRRTTPAQGDYTPRNLR